MVFSLKKPQKPRLLGCFRSLQGKKSPFQAIFDQMAAPFGLGGLSAKRNKLPGIARN
jgi:hypothetical protein